MRYTDFHIHISKEEVCRLLDGEKSGLQKMLEEELEEMLPEARRRLDPAAFLGFGDEEEALYVITTVGADLSDWSGQLFGEGDCVRAMLADALADVCLFQMDRQLREEVLRLCRRRGKGIARRLEAHQDAPMELQRKAFHVTGAGQYGMEITEGLMYRPVKSACQVFLLSDERDQFFWEHDCSGCSNTSCRMRRGRPVVLTVEAREKGGQESRQVKGHVERGKSILETLGEWGIPLASPCGGRGTCGKCRIRILEGQMPVTEADRRFFSEEELEAGLRLVCRAIPEGDCRICLEGPGEDGFFIPESRMSRDHGRRGAESPEEEKRAVGKAVAVDIGTTTLAMELVDPATGRIEGSYTALNPQRRYGADVIARIQAAGEGKGSQMQACIREALREGLDALTEKGEARIRQIVIGANTTMVHLLMGYPCSSLGVWPFEPYDISSVDGDSREVLGDETGEFAVHIFPGVSAYIGGDITAGLYALGFHETERIRILVDLGTNGEMAVGNRDRILAASAAAGPAFEGGNITCGTGSIPGAICGVRWNGRQMELRTIGGESPAGICGTGIIETAYEMRRAGVLDETGRLEEPWDEEGFPLDEAGRIRIFQEDIRELQLAKAAVRAGLETLLIAYGIRAEDVDAFCIAGGFGCQLDMEKAAGIGLLPEEAVGKADPAGNTSLAGALRWLREEKGGETADRLAGYVREVPLSANKDFQRFYMEYMYFGEDEE